MMKAGDLNLSSPLSCEKCGPIPFEDTMITQEAGGKWFITGHEKCGGSLLFPLKGAVPYTPGDGPKVAE